MRISNVRDHNSWKQLFQDAILEANPGAFRERLEAARKAIEDRLLEINSARDPDPLELAQLTYAQSTLSVLQREENHMS
jgi:hypothetical protein